jgi:hypothetical protein
MGVTVSRQDDLAQLFAEHDVWLTGQAQLAGAGDVRRARCGRDGASASGAAWV